MTDKDQLVNPATLRVRLVDGPFEEKAVALKLIRTMDEDASFFACKSCKRLHLEKANAEKCCVPYTCRVCGVETPQYYTACERHSQGARLQKATIAERSPCGWVYDECGGGHQDGYFDSVESLLDWYVDEAESRPLYVYACKERPWKGISLGDVLQNEHEDHYEDAEDSLVEVKELGEFLTVWNAKQKIVSYDVDYSRVIPIDADGFAALLAELKQEFALKAV
jgi:hypothetical protein